MFLQFNFSISKFNSRSFLNFTLSFKVVSCKRSYLSLYFCKQRSDSDSDSDSYSDSSVADAVADAVADPQDCRMN